MGGIDSYVVLEREEWLDARPLATTKAGERYCNLITPYRHFLRAQLWITYTLLRFIVTMVLFTALVAYLTFLITS